MRSFVTRAVLRLDHLAHALAAGVIDVIGRAATAQIHLLQLVFKVPQPSVMLLMAVMQP